MHQAASVAAAAAAVDGQAIPSTSRRKSVSRREGLGNDGNDDHDGGGDGKSLLGSFAGGASFRAAADGGDGDAEEALALAFAQKVAVASERPGSAFSFTDATRTRVALRPARLPPRAADSARLTANVYHGTRSRAGVSAMLAAGGAHTRVDFFFPGREIYRWVCNEVCLFVCSGAAVAAALLKRAHDSWRSVLRAHHPDEAAMTEGAGRPWLLEHQANLCRQVSTAVALTIG